MGKQTFRFIIYLLFSLSFGITITFIIDGLEDVVLEKKIRKELEQEIRNAAVSFQDAAGNVTPDETTTFLWKFSSTAMRDKIMAVDPARGKKPDSREAAYLFTFAESDRNMDFYVKNSFLTAELALLDLPELIYGIIATIVVFAFVTLYAEKKRQALVLRNQYEIEHAELRKALEKQEALALLGRMAATLAHELKTPIATISNLVQVLPSRIADSNFTSRFVAMTKEELNRTYQLIDNLLVYGKDIEIKEKEWVACRDLISESARKNTISFTCPDLKILGDKFYLGLLFENLVRNSREAGAGEVTVSLKSPSPESDQYAELLFEDNGKGFPVECDLDELIDPFVTSRSRGAGLGLFLAKRIVTAHHGSISLYRPGGGAGVKIRLPLKTIKHNE
jgi:signal transduction histidine kinase